MNKVALHGFLARDIELRQGGTVVSTNALGIQVDALVGKTAIGVQRPKGGSDFINLVAFGKTAETMAKYLKKGSEVLVEGRIQVGSYTNKEGHKVTTTDVIIERFEFCGSKGTKAKEEDFITVDADNDEGVPFV